MSNSFGSAYRVTIFGQSHAPSIGAVIEGLPPGFLPDWDAVGAFMRRRAPGGRYASPRIEDDVPEILSGLNERGETCGAPLCVNILNKDARSSDYDALRDVPRPGHADYPAFVRCGGANDIRGGGQFSGRLTAPLCFAGALALQLLRKKGISVLAHISEIAGIQDAPFPPLAPEVPVVCENGLTLVNASRAAKMAKAIDEARRDGDSVGGIVECAVTGLPAGLGDPMFDGVENRLARILWGIPGVRGLEFGAGFAASRMRGSEHNDPWVIEDGGVRTAANRHGGVLGGMTTGMPILLRLAFKPTPSIAREQMSVSLKNRCPERLCLQGRHDPCIVPRAVVCVEAAAAIAIYDMIAERSMI